MARTAICNLILGMWSQVWQIIYWMGYVRYIIGLKEQDFLVMCIVIRIQLAVESKSDDSLAWEVK